MIRVRGIQQLSLIKGNSLNLAVKINCIDTIERVVFNCPSLGIVKDLSLLNELFVLYYSADQTSSFPVGVFKYSLTLHLKTNGVRTAIYNSTIAVQPAVTSGFEEHCPYDSSANYDTEEFCPAPALFIDLLDVIQVVPNAFSNVTLGVNYEVAEQGPPIKIILLDPDSIYKALLDYIDITTAKQLTLFLNGPKAYKLSYCTIEKVEDRITVTGIDFTHSSFVSLLFASTSGTYTGVITPVNMSSQEIEFLPHATEDGTSTSAISYKGREYNLVDEGARKQLDSKQDTLKSGENIKTINGESILGAGDLVIGVVAASDDRVGGMKTGYVDTKDTRGVKLDSQSRAYVRVPSYTAGEGLELTKDNIFNVKNLSTDTLKQGTEDIVLDGGKISEIGG